MLLFWCQVLVKVSDLNRRRVVNAAFQGVASPPPTPSMQRNVVAENEAMDHSGPSSFRGHQLNTGALILLT